ncbi:MAG: hypothetical protein RL038_1059 [Actinomycetota bacterium]|jgi:uncharacterized protein (TIGR02611 family)
MSDREKKPDDSENEIIERIEEVAEEFVEDVETAIESVLPPHLRLRLWMLRRPVTHAIWRASVLIIGIVLVIAGIFMLVLPGPGWVTIFLGLAVLSSEFAWAHRFYGPLQRAFEWAKQKAQERANRKRNK